MTENQGKGNCHDWVLRVFSVAAERMGVCVVGSTNQDMETSIRRGEFRQDLFYRLNVMTVIMPGLEFFDEAQQRLLRRKWPGNVRELENTVNRAVLLCPGSIIEPTDLGGVAEEDWRPFLEGGRPSGCSCPARRPKTRCSSSSIAPVSARPRQCRGFPYDKPCPGGPARPS
jgi:DNA-binding NtrC family response regulator